MWSLINLVVCNIYTLFVKSLESLFQFMALCDIHSSVISIIYYYERMFVFANKTYVTFDYYWK